MAERGQQNSGSGGGGGRNSYILGFFMDFKTNSVAAFKKIQSGLAKTHTEFKKSTKGIRSNLVYITDNIRALRGEMSNWAASVREAGLSMNDVIADIGENFGAVAGVIADTLMRPGALVAAAVSVAGRAGVQMNQTMVAMRRHANLTEAELMKVREAIAQVTNEMEVDPGQSQGLAKAFGSARLAVEEYVPMMRIAIDLNRLTQKSTDELSNQLLELRQHFRMSPKDIRTFYNELYGAANESQLHVSDLIDKTMQFSQMVSRVMPRNLAKGLSDAGKIRAVLGNVVGDADQLMQQFYASSLDVSSQAFIGMRNLAAQAGPQVMEAFDKGMKSQDFVSAFDALLKGAKQAYTQMGDQMFALPDIFRERFALDPSVVRDLMNIDDTMSRTVLSGAKMAASIDNINKSTNENVDITQRWFRLWNRMKEIALPFGETLVSLLEPILKNLVAILEPIGKFVASLSEGEKKASLLAFALLTASKWISPLTDMTKILGERLVTASTHASKLFLWSRATSKEAVTVAGAYGEVYTVLRDSNGITATLTKTMGTLATVATSVVSSVVSMGKALFAVTWPLVAISALVTVVNGFLKEMFDVTLIDLFTKALEVVSWTLSQIGTVIGWIVKGVVLLGTMGQVNLFKENPAKPATTTVGQSTTSDLLRGAMADPASMESTAELLNKEKIVVARDPKGTDEITEATYYAADAIVAAIRANSSQNGKTPAYGVAGNMQRSVPINDGTNSGPR